MAVRESDLLLQSRCAVQRGHDLPPAKISLRGEDEAERARRTRREYQKRVKVKKRKQRKHKPRPSALAAPLARQFATANDAQCLTFHEWCQLNRFSERTGRRILATGNGPKVVALSSRRIGITVGANREWQAARERA